MADRSIRPIGGRPQRRMKKIRSSRGAGAAAISVGPNSSICARTRPPEPGSLRSAVEIQPDRLKPLAVLEPILADLDEQEQMDPALEHRFELGSGAFADGLDPPPALAQHDRLLARPLDEDRLSDLGAAILELFPALGLDR